MKRKIIWGIYLRFNLHLNTDEEVSFSIFEPISSVKIKLSTVILIQHIQKSIVCFSFSQRSDVQKSPIQLSKMQNMNTITNMRNRHGNNVSINIRLRSNNVYICH